MSAANVIAEAFGEGANLYSDVLALPSAGPDVSPAQLRKAYYKQALLYHPDKQHSKPRSEADEAKAKFQAVSVAYSILSKSESRAEYDKSGELYDDEDDEGKSGTEAWEEYFRGIFGKVTAEDIDKFEAQYKCSEEEERDVLRYYKQFKGDLNKMLECVMLSQEIDKNRWIEDYIMPAIKRGDTKHYREAMERTTASCDSDEDTESEEDSVDEKRGAKVKSGKKVSAKIPHKKGEGLGIKHKVGTKQVKKKDKYPGGLDEDLIAAIRGNAVARSKKSFNAMLTGLEQRYSSEEKGNKNSRKKNSRIKSSDNELDDIPDDEFQKIQARMDKNRRKKKK